MSISQRVLTQPPELKVWEREHDILGDIIIALSVETLFDHVTLPSTPQYIIPSLLNPHWSI